MKKILFISIPILMLAGCAYPGYYAPPRNTLVGAGVGALAGQAIGHNTESTLIGAGIGALAGSLWDYPYRGGYAAQPYWSYPYSWSGGVIVREGPYHYHRYDRGHYRAYPHRRSGGEHHGRRFEGFHPRGHGRWGR